MTLTKTTPPPSTLPDYITDWFNRIIFTGRLNVGGFVSDHTPTTYGLIPSNIGKSPPASDINITNANLTADAKPIDWLSTKLSLNFGQTAPSFMHSPPGGGNVFYIDQAYATLADPKKSPFYVTAGIKYLDFGGVDFHSFLESTYQLFTLGGRTVLQPGINWHDFNASAYIFRGYNHVNTLNNTTEVNTFGLNLNYVHIDTAFGYIIGADYISDFLGGFYPSSTVAHNSTLSSGYSHTSVPAVAIHTKVNMKAFDVIANYASALTSASVLDVPFTTNSGNTFIGAKPAAWGMDIGYTFPMLNKYSSRLSVGYQGSSEAAAIGTVNGSVVNPTSGVYGNNFAIGLPQARYYSIYIVTLNNWVRIGAQYAYDQGYSVTNGGTGRASNTGVLMLITKF